VGIQFLKKTEEKLKDNSILRYLAKAKLRMTRV
jgi:hypothetical protein